jgi:hypothetical protein
VSGAGIHHPEPSYWPFLAAVGVLLLFIALMHHEAKFGPCTSSRRSRCSSSAFFNWVFENRPEG